MHIKHYYKPVMAKIILVCPFMCVIIILLICVFFGGSKAEEYYTRLNENGQSKVSRTITVDKSGRGNFKTIQEAVDSVPSGNDQWIRIHLNPGLYIEKVTIDQDRPFILLEGSGYGITIIAWNDHDRTDTSATFTVLPDNFVAKGITFQNSYNRALEINSDEDRVPAVAARIYGDKSAFHQCAFVGVQDTLWDVQGRHYFNSCYIEGAVDFIWGGGQSFYEDCSINVTAGLLPQEIAAGYITAQGRNSPNDPSGFVFTRGTVYGSGQVYLGRAYGPYSTVIFYGTSLGKVIVPQGWDPWTYQGNEKNFLYAEVNCNGLGADTSKRVEWVNLNIEAGKMEHFSRSNFIDQDQWLSNQP